VAVVVTLVVSLGGASEPPARPTATTKPRAPSVPPPAPPLALGVTEANPALIAPGDVPPPFARWRDRLAALRPAYVRVLVDWARVQPAQGAPPDWTAHADGCLRGLPPCAPYAGIRDQLRAAAAAGLRVVFTFLDTPAWAAAAPSGCERPQTKPGARLPADPAAYAALVRSLLAEARADGIGEAWWSAWNEPNHPAFLNPQRASCDAAAPTLADDGYAALFRVLRGELAAAPGPPQHLVLGDVAGIGGPRPRATGAAELAAALPDDVVCSAGIWAQHAYVAAPGPLGGDRPSDPGSAALLRSVEEALARHHCSGPPPRLWITETGMEPGRGMAGCRAMATALRSWADDPRVDVAFQYTFRDDTAFRVGLADARLSALHPAYAAWRAWAGGAPPAARPC
jgi:hypothetical protein